MIVCRRLSALNWAGNHALSAKPIQGEVDAGNNNRNWWWERICSSSKMQKAMFAKILHLVIIRY